jgi:RNA polymerase sigma factor (sigma-70 family)
MIGHAASDEPAGRRRGFAMTPETTRPSLLSQVRDPANQAAWTEFERRYRELILRYCRRCSLSAADAEDVGQMVMVRLVRVLPRFQYDPARGRFHDYLYRVTRSAISDFRTCPDSRQRTVVDDELAERLATGDDGRADPAFEQEWRDNHLRLALATVRQTADARSVEVFERLLAGASVEQCAADFGLSADAVHKVKQRMRDRVQARIAEQIREEEDPHG